jgi:uncharacterized membrane protein YphA (DoxX/SURF4 family)
LSSDSIGQALGGRWCGSPEGVPFAQDIQGLVDMRCKRLVGTIVSILLGLVFIVAGLGKLIDPAEFFTVLTPFQGYLTPASVRGVFTWLPRVELILGCSLIVGVFVKLAAASSIVLIVSFMVNNIWLLSRGLGYKPCGCLGILERITQLKLTAAGALYLDITMLVFVAAILMCYQGSLFAIQPWFVSHGKIGLGQLKHNR